MSVNLPISSSSASNSSEMRPAFSSTNQAAAFGLLLLVLLAAPLLSGKWLLPPREQAYAAQGWNWGPLPWDRKQIFQETNDIDIAFLGSSRINWGIDTPYVQQRLEEKLGRKSVVLSICWGGAGFDTLYITAKDLLEHRHVKMLVFDDESFNTEPAKGAEYWFRFGDEMEMLKNLPLRDQFYYYFAGVVGMPRNAVELLAPNLPEAANNPIPNYYVEYFNAANPESRLGAITTQLGFRYTGSKRHEIFAPYSPITGATPSDTIIYTPATATNFLFSNGPLPTWQAHFTRLLAGEAKRHGCKLALLEIPIYRDRSASFISESTKWPEFLQADVAMVGIPSKKLFAGLSDEQVRMLYADDLHFNQNGAKYFTPLVVPALFQLYENYTAY